MMSNFHASRWNIRAKLAVPAVSLSMVSCVTPIALDAPAVMMQPKLEIATHQPKRVIRARIQIRSAKATGTSLDHALVREIVHPEDREGLSSPILIAAKVVQRFEDLSVTASPVIVLNGKVYARSVVKREKDADFVYAVVHSEDRLGLRSRVQVGWLGDMKATISEPVTLSLEGID